MTECNKVCFDEELVENERYHQGAMGSGDYTYECLGSEPLASWFPRAKYVGEGRGDLRKIPARSEYRCNTCCQAFESSLEKAPLVSRCSCAWRSLASLWGSCFGSPPRPSSDSRPRMRPLLGSLAPSTATMASATGG